MMAILCIARKSIACFFVSFSVPARMGKVNDFLSIVIENNYDSKIKLENKKTTKKDTFLHGYGIQNIKNAVEKYNGTCTITKEDEKFILKILLPLTNK